MSRRSSNAALLIQELKPPSKECLDGSTTKMGSGLKAILASQQKNQSGQEVARARHDKKTVPSVYEASCKSPSSESLSSKPYLDYSVCGAEQWRSESVAEYTADQLNRGMDRCDNSNWNVCRAGRSLIISLTVTVLLGRCIPERASNGWCPVYVQQCQSFIKIHAFQQCDVQ